MSGKVVSNELLQQAVHIETTFEMVDKLLQIGEANDALFIQVKWLGQHGNVDWTWQPLQALYDDAPDKDLSFFALPSGLGSRERRLLSLTFEIDVMPGRCPRITWGSEECCQMW